MAAVTAMASTAMAGCTVLAPLVGDNGLPGAAPACSWPLRVIGPATAAQSGLDRCYLRAVAWHDLAALQGLVNPTYRATNAQLSQTADARAGRASATITPSTIDTGIATVRIDYADGAVCQFGIEIVNPQVAGSWRIDVGPSAPGPRGPPPAKASPVPATVYVANCNSDTVTVIRDDSQLGAPVNVGRWPCAIAITPDGRMALVVGDQPGTVTSISAATNTARRKTVTSYRVVPTADMVSTASPRRYGLRR